MTVKIAKLSLLLATVFLCACQADYRSEVVSENKETSLVAGKDKKTSKTELSPTQSDGTGLRVTSTEAGESKPLSEIAKEPLKIIDCEEQFKNENGVCEVPNQPHPEKFKKPIKDKD